MFFCTCFRVINIHICLHTFSKVQTCIFLIAILFFEISKLVPFLKIEFLIHNVKNTNTMPQFFIIQYCIFCFMDHM